MARATGLHRQRPPRGVLARKGRVDVKRPGNIRGRPIQLLVDPVAEPANSLGEQHIGRNKIDPHQHIQPLAPGIDRNGQNPTDQPPVDAQPTKAAVPKVEDFLGVLHIIVEADPIGGCAEHMVKARAENPHNQRPGQNVPDMVGIVARPGSSPACQPRSQHSPADNKDAVPVQRERTPLKDDRIHTRPLST